MSRRLVLIVVVALLAVSFVAIAAPAKASSPAATSISGTIRSRIARLRASPGTHGTIMMTLKRGQTLTVLGAAKGRHWLKVQVVPSGQVGWVATFLIHLNGIRLTKVPVVPF